MKKILTIAAIFCALSAFGQITSTGGVVYLVEGDIMAYTTPTIIINPTFNKATDQVLIRAQVCAAATTQAVFETTYVVSRATVDAFAGAGTGETNQFHWCCQLAYIAYLEGIAANSAITFTPN